MPLPSAPERAVILAAGLGSRLRPFTDHWPKPLTPVHGVPILHNALARLAEAGVRETTLVVGYRKEAIRASCGDRFAGMAIRYVESTVFDQTGSAYSLWLARETLLAGGALLLEGDVFFEAAVLERLLDGSGNRAAVAPFDAAMSGSAALLDGARIREIRTGQTAAEAAGRLFKTMNLFRLSGASLREIVTPGLDALIGSGARQVFLEQLFAQLIRESGLEIEAVDCGDRRWFEIDSEADLRIAEAIFAPAALRAAESTAAAQ